MIYFIRPVGRTGPVKVGATKRSTAVRLAEFQRDCPDRLELIAELDADFKVERRLHILLAEHHLWGEWFEWSPTLAVLVAAATSGQFDPARLPPSGVRPFTREGRYGQ